jgi:hypothetical protein
MRMLIALLLAAALVGAVVGWWTSGQLWFSLVPGIHVSIFSLYVIVPLSIYTVLLAIAGVRVFELLGGRRSE